MGKKEAGGTPEGLRLLLAGGQGAALSLLLALLFLLGVALGIYTDLIAPAHGGALVLLSAGLGGCLGTLFGTRRVLSGRRIATLFGGIFYCLLLYLLSFPVCGGVRVETGGLWVLGAAALGCLLGGLLCGGKKHKRGCA